MSKKYDYKKIQSYRSYKTRDICRIFKEKKLHEQTIRGWVKYDKLKGFFIGKILYIYGAVLKEFLRNRNNKYKSLPLELNQFKCWKCKAINEPHNKTVERLTFGISESIRAYAICPSCEKEMFRNYKRSEYSEILKLFKINQNELMGLCDSSNSTRTTHIKNNQKIALGESLELSELPKTEKLPKKKIQTITTTKNTNIKKEKTISSTKKTNINSTQLDLFNYEQPDDKENDYE